MSGALLLELFGALSQVVDLQDSTVADTEASPTAASCSISVNRDGTVAFTGNGSDSGYDWASPKFATVGDGYTIELTVDTGDAPTSGDSTATILALTSNRQWIWNTGAGPATLSASCTLELRTAGGTLVDSATISVASESVN